MNVYFIPGLGADKRVFKHIRLPDGYEYHYLDWLQPNKNESLQEYAYRLANNIDTSNPFIIIGLSFGGMLAAEIVKRYQNGRMILISSVACSGHLPLYYRVAGTIRLHKLIPISLLKSAALMKRLFTAETTEQKAYLRKMIREVDEQFIRWGLDAIVKWKGGDASGSILHIHGSSDGILPVSFCKPTHVIKGGGHLMVLTHANEINNILQNYLSAS
jgi:pimeloyl-ACP methyl ester carboxylesterase